MFDIYLVNSLGTCQDSTAKQDFSYQTNEKSYFKMIGSWFLEFLQTIACLYFLLSFWFSFCVCISLYLWMKIMSKDFPQSWLILPYPVLQVFFIKLTICSIKYIYPFVCFLFLLTILIFTCPDIDIFLTQTHLLNKYDFMGQKRNVIFFSTSKYLCSFVFIEFSRCCNCIYK